MADSSDTASHSALTAFITEAADSNSPGVDPVCTAAVQAYLGSLLAGQPQDAADEAAAVAYVAALDANPGASSDTESACSKAAEAYIANFSK